MNKNKRNIAASNRKRKKGNYRATHFSNFFKPYPFTNSKAYAMLIHKNNQTCPQNPKNPNSKATEERKRGIEEKRNTRGRDEKRGNDMR
ncbi:hypothetical protein HN51_034744 [Arachis hypogaea]